MPSRHSRSETVDRLPYPSDGRLPGPPTRRSWTIFAYGGAMYDSNLFGVELAGESDMVARVGFGGRTLNRIVGRQRLPLDGYEEYNDYNDFNEIDHFAYGLRADWLWNSSQLDGTVRYARAGRRLGDFGELRTPERTMVSEEAVIVDGNYRFSPNWRIFAGAEHARDKRDNDELEWLNRTSLRGGLRYRTPLGNEIGIEVVGTRGEARVDVPAGGGGEVSFVDDYDQTEVAATLAYVLGAQLRINGRVAQLERSYDNLPARDFGGVSYRALVEWLPTTRLIFSLEGYRVPQSLADVTATHVITEGGALGVSWAATSSWCSARATSTRTSSTKATPTQSGSGSETARTRCKLGASARAGRSNAICRSAWDTTTASAPPTCPVAATTTSR